RERESMSLVHRRLNRFGLSSVSAWNVQIREAVNRNDPAESLLLFREMKRQGFEPSNLTFPFVAKACAKLADIAYSKMVHTHVIKSTFWSDVFVGTATVDMFVKCNRLDYACKVFDEMPERDATTWNAMLSGFCQPDQDTEAINTLISMYSKSGDISSARLLFDVMSSRTCVSWTVMISGYTEKGDMDEALALFRAMKKTEVSPDLVTLLSLISGCGKFGSLEIGRWVDARADTYGFKRDNVMVCNALIDMYSKCGSVTEARDIFDNMSEKTVVTWTTMIAGYALNGVFLKALELFKTMIDLDYKPNHITLLAVLQACAHSGSLEKGWECFLTMKEVYNINPGLEHYSCMVDLLGRKGKLEEALELIRSMSCKPDAGIWGALLSACKIHRNVKVAEQVAECLFNLEPETAAPYVEMANIYAAAGMWDGFARIRSMMKVRNVKKYPGESVIQVDGKSHTFTVGERDHAEHETIYHVLDGLSLFAREKHTLHKETYVTPLVTCITTNTLHGEK
ncbi:hypothetical protein HID58_056727, partial [Brassica napus]